MQFKAIFRENNFEISFNDDLTRAEVNGKSADIKWTVQKNNRRLLRIDNKLYKIDDPQIQGSQVSFRINGEWVHTEVKNEQDLLLERLGFQTNQIISAGRIDAPMPGKILEILVAKADEVDRGQPILILEAMKMENEIKATGSGTIIDVFVKTGDSVEKNQPLIEIKSRG